MDYIHNLLDSGLYSNISDAENLNIMLKRVIEARKASLGDGMQVQRILPFRKQRMVRPFIFMDHGGLVTLTPKTRTSFDVLPHPHIGLSDCGHFRNVFAGTQFSSSTTTKPDLQRAISCRRTKD